MRPPARVALLFQFVVESLLAELVRCGLLQLEHFGVRGTPFGFEVFGPATLHTGAPNPPAILKSVFLPVSIRTSACSQRPPAPSASSLSEA